MEIIRTGRVTGRQTAKNRDGADSVRLLQAVVTDRDDVQTVQLVSQTGEESNPPDGSVVVLVPAGPALKLAVAMLDRVPPDLAVGGKRIYSTADDGTTVKAEVRLDPDGKITVSNPGATITITPAGLVTIDAAGETVVNSSKTTINNDVQINGNLDVSGTVTAPNVVGTTDVAAAGISGKTHTHGGVTTGAGNTGAPQ